MKNGLNVKIENLSIDKGNKNVLTQLANHYDSWQKDWREQLTIEPGTETPDEMPAEEPIEEPIESPEAEGGTGAADAPPTGP